MHRLIGLLLLWLAGTAQAQEAGPILRHYTAGETLRYRLVQTESRNGVQTRLEAVTEHVVSTEAASEQVHWISLTPADASDAAALRALAPYHLSLVPGGRLASPRPRDSVALLGLVTDLQTFYVAVSPALGAGRLRSVGDRFTRAEPVTGDFADGDHILAGKDCTVPTLTLKSITESEIVVETDFAPPATSCLPPHAQPAATTGAVPDNFMMVRAVGDTVLDLAGTERFVITTTLDRGSFRIRSAAMVNTLRLRGRSCTDRTLTSCSVIPDLVRERKVTLELLP
jgi:hypothetical protein